VTWRFKDEVWAIIPARGGSKTIPLKNMVNLNGRPLISYVIEAAKASRSITRIICSTENKKIATFCMENDIEVQKRPLMLAKNNVPTLDVIIYFLETFMKREGEVANILVLLEPTSPFVLRKHINDCIQLLKTTPDADSVQTVTLPPPNHHAYNQRYLKNGMICFMFPKERNRFYNKQLKPEFYIHGNLRIFRSASILNKADLYGDRSIPYIISRIYATDVDGPEDLKMAECMLKSGMLSLP